mmetsp:Transcript_1106/g.1376  ORF Transcript_1106/g.1376 Transcript_1106/m.1376 type:complete len:295 (-) Transcript_1106:138-1022(-)
MRSSLIMVTIGVTSAFVQPNRLVQRGFKASSTQASMVESTSFIDSVFHVAQHLTPMAEIAMPPQATQLIHDIECSSSIVKITHICDNAMNSYSDMLRDRPLATKAATAGVVSALGDAMAQRRDASSLNISSKEYDIMKGASMIIFSVLYAGIFQHYWFDWLNNNLVETASAVHPSVAVLLAKSYGPNLLAASKLFLNQVFIVPTVYMPLFFAVTGALAGLTVNDSLTRARSQFLPLLQQKYAFWLPAQFIQFAFVSPEWQITYLCSAGLVWTMILSSFGSSCVSSESEIKAHTE